MKTHKKLWIWVFVVAAVAVFVLVAFRMRQRRSAAMPRLYQKKFEFLSKEPDWYVADPIVGFAHPPFAKRNYDWAEHPLGKIELSTNNLGFREDRETLVDKPSGTSRFLVVGDSHIDGVVYNRESFPHRLEAELVRAHPARKFEVLNAGTGMFGPAQYARTLEKHLRLRPEAFIVVVYSGNDFLEVLAYGPESETVQHPRGYFESLSKAAQIDGAAVSQGLNQVCFYRAHPDLKQTALQRTFEQFELIIDSTRQENIRFYVVLLPTKLDVEWHTDAERLDRVARALELTPEQLKINEWFRVELGKWLESKGVRTWDATPELSKADKPTFWREDYHLNVVGHELLGVEFIRKFGSRP